MILKNKTRKTILAINLKEAKTLSDKLLGLLKSENPRTLLFKTRFGLHTFFLKEEIDVIVLNKLNRVAIATTLKPNKIFIYNPMLETVIELPKNTIRLSKTKKNDTLKMI